MSATPLYFPRKIENGQSVDGDPVEITVGMPLTMIIGSDRYPYEVSEIIDTKTIKVRSLNAVVTKRAENYGDEPEYRYESDPKGAIITLRFCTRKGRTYWFRGYKEEGSNRWEVSDSYFFAFGYARKYTDPHF